MHAPIIYSHVIFYRIVFDFTSLQQQLISIKGESESRSQHIEFCNLKISHLSEDVKRKEAELVRLKNELQSYEQVYGTPEQLLELFELDHQVAELERKLQEAEDQKQQLELERDTASEEVKAMKDFVILLHTQLGKNLNNNQPQGKGAWD